LRKGVPNKNTVARLESNISGTQNILSPQKLLGWLRHWYDQKLFALKNRC